MDLEENHQQHAEIPLVIDKQGGKRQQERECEKESLQKSPATVKSQAKFAY